MRKIWTFCTALMFLAMFDAGASHAFRSGLLVTSVKIAALGASNTQAWSANNFNPYLSQATGLFKITTSVVNLGIGGLSTTDVDGNFIGYVQGSYDATKTVNILTIQFGGDSTGDLDSNVSSATGYYNRILSIAAKWRALGPHTKVVIFTPWGYLAKTSDVIPTYQAANALIMADTTHFDAIINSAASAPIFAPSTVCPSVAQSADCEHLTEAGHTLLVNAYITAVNGVF